MPDRHTSHPKAVRMPDGLRAWFEKHAAGHDQSVNAALVEALEEFRDRHDPARSDGMSKQAAVRFTPALVTAARQIAGRDGMTLSAWVRRIVDQEIGRREGKCPTCGQPPTA